MVRKKTSKELKLVIADVTILLTSDSCDFDVDNNLKRFISNTDSEPELVLRVHRDTIPDFDFGEPIYSWEKDVPYLLSKEKIYGLDSTFGVYRKNGKEILYLCTPPVNPHTYRLAIFDSDFKSGDIFIKHAVSAIHHDIVEKPLYYPLDSFLMIKLFSLGRGIILHACGIANGGRGIVFAGHSGAGKSTIAKLWQSVAEVVSDDRLVIRKGRDTFQIYDGPYQARIRAFPPKPEGVPLEKIFFIKHAPENTVIPMAVTEAVANLIARTYNTYWDSSGMQSTMDFCGELAAAVPCYELGFVPNESVLDFVRSIQ